MLMWKNKFQIKKLKDALQSGIKTPRDNEGYLQDLEMHQVIYGAIIDVGKYQLFELEREVYPYLYDVYSGFREEAVITLGWSTSLAIPEFCRSQAYKIWMGDVDDDVRVAALVAWSWYCISVKDSGFLHVLLAILRGNDFSFRMRVHALKSIYDAGNVFSNVRQVHSIFDLLDLEDPTEFENAIDFSHVEKTVHNCIALWEK